MLAYYVHHLSPFIYEFPEVSWLPPEFGLRWYGMAYVLGFLCAFLLLRALARRGYSEIDPQQAGDFITWCALLGVMLGGRLGYMLLYDLDRFLHNPLVFFDVLGGGMASHGGILGMLIFTVLYARRHRISALGLCDSLVVVSPLGVFFGRLANFVNGELYGRITTAVPWAVQFPTELREIGGPLRVKVQNALPDLLPYPEAVIEASRENPEVRDILREFLNPRHPSQVYQALLEGLSVFAILLIVRLLFKNLRHGILTGLFFLLYALFRILAEFFRERDSGQDPILGMNPGQFYSLFMVVVGIALITAALLRRPRPSPGA